MDRLLFGDNQFFGVNHMSEEKARSQAMRFRDTQAILNVLDCAYDNGIKTFMCTTHDRMDEICEHISTHSGRYSEFQFYPCMPYAHKYANAVGQLGLLGTLKKYAPGSMMGAVLQGAMSAMNKDVYRMMKLLVDTEMKNFRDVKTPIVFLQNIVTDLLLGLGMHDMFREFYDHIKEKFDAEPAFITMNLPRLLDALTEVGIENPIVCSSINKIGFRMCGGLDMYEEVIAERKFRPVAMSIFASGAIPAEEAIKYICEQERIESVVFGASSEKNIRNTRELFEKYTVDGSLSLRESASRS